MRLKVLQETQMTSSPRIYTHTHTHTHTHTRTHVRAHACKLIAFYCCLGMSEHFSQSQFKFRRNGIETRNLILFWGVSHTKKNNVSLLLIVSLSTLILIRNLKKLTEEKF